MRYESRGAYVRSDQHGWRSINRAERSESLLVPISFNDKKKKNEHCVWGNRRVPCARACAVILRNSGRSSGSRLIIEQPDKFPGSLIETLKNNSHRADHRTGWFVVQFTFRFDFDSINATRLYPSPEQTPKNARSSTYTCYSPRISRFSLFALVHEVFIFIFSVYLLCFSSRRSPLCESAALPIRARYLTFLLFTGASVRHTSTLPEWERFLVHRYRIFPS